MTQIGPLEKFRYLPPYSFGKGRPFIPFPIDDSPKLILQRGIPLFYRKATHGDPKFADAHLKSRSLIVFAPVGLSGIIEEKMRNAGDYSRVLLGDTEWLKKMKRLNGI